MKKHTKRIKAHGAGLAVFVLLFVLFTIPALAGPPASPRQMCKDSSGNWSPCDGGGIDSPSLESDEVSTPAPTTKGHPDTITSVNTTGVPVHQYTPEYLASDIQKPVIPVSKTYATSVTIPRREAFGYIFDNTGAGAATTITLPHAEPGMSFGFLTVADYDLTVQPNSADTIDPFGIVTADNTVTFLDPAAGGAIDLEAVGDFMQLYCYRWSRWTAVYAVGTVVKH